MMIYIDKYAYISALNRTKPELKLLFGLATLIAVICASSVLSFITVIATMSLITVFKAKIPIRYYLKLMTLCFGFLAFGILGIVISISAVEHASAVLSASFYGYYITVTQQSIHIALSLALKALAAVSCLYFIILTTPMRDIIYFLHLAKCPGTIITLIMMTYRFIFLLMDIAVIKIKSQQVRHGYSKAKNFPKTFGMLWGSVFIQSFLASEWVYKAMIVRGHEGNVKMLPKTVRLTKTEVSAALVLPAIVTFISVIAQN